MSNFFQVAARAGMKALLRAGGAHLIKYRRSTGEIIDTIGARDESVDEFGGFESTVSEWRQAWDLLVEDVGNAPCRGDTLIDHDGKNWTVQDILESQSDEEVVRVTVT